MDVLALRDTPSEHIGATIDRLQHPTRLPQPNANQALFCPSLDEISTVWRQEHSYRAFVLHEYNKTTTNLPFGR